MKVRKTMAILLAVSLLLVGSTSVGAAKNSNSIQMQKKLTVEVGKTKKLKVTGKKIKKVIFSSSSKKIATVSKKGVVKGKKVGRATIRAKVGKKTLISQIHVIEKKKKTVSPVQSNMPQPTLSVNVSSVPSETPSITSTPNASCTPTAFTTPTASIKPTASATPGSAKPKPTAAPTYKPLSTTPEIPVDIELKKDNMPQWCLDGTQGTLEFYEGGEVDYCSDFANPKEVVNERTGDKQMISGNICSLGTAFYADPVEHKKMDVSMYRYIKLTIDAELDPRRVLELVVCYQDEEDETSLWNKDFLGYDMAKTTYNKENNTMTYVYSLKDNRISTITWVGVKFLTTDYLRLDYSGTYRYEDYKTYHIKLYNIQFTNDVEVPEKSEDDYYITMSKENAPDWVSDGSSCTIDYNEDGSIEYSTAHVDKEGVSTTQRDRNKAVFYADPENRDCMDARPYDYLAITCSQSVFPVAHSLKGLEVGSYNMVGEVENEDGTWTRYFRVKDLFVVPSAVSEVGLYMYTMEKVDDGVYVETVKNCHIKEIKFTNHLPNKIAERLGER